VEEAKLRGRQGTVSMASMYRQSTRESTQEGDGDTALKLAQKRKKDREAIKTKTRCVNTANQVGTTHHQYVRI